MTIFCVRSPWQNFDLNPKLINYHLCLYTYTAAAEAALAATGSSDRKRGTLRPASDATWRPEMKCAFPGPRQLYVLLFLLKLVVTSAHLKLKLRR